MMCQCKSISCNKCTTVMGVLVMRGCTCVTAGDIREITVSSLQFCCEPDMAQKYSLFKKSILDYTKGPVLRDFCSTYNVFE